jgi:hypothetical protein
VYPLRDPQERLSISFLTALIARFDFIASIAGALFPHQAGQLENCPRCQVVLKWEAFLLKRDNNVGQRQRSEAKSHSSP